ncbi:ERCC4 domain-containing protein [Mycena latifolia]|nr:ERCC4 domain-containing protein [Mycena latifolia]
MPRAKAPRLNAQFIEWLEDLKNQQEPDSNWHRVYKKALNNLKDTTKEFATPRELIEVKGIGPVIVATLEKRYLDNGGLAQPLQAAPTPNPRARPLKRAATDVDQEPPPQAKRRTVSAAALSARVPATQPVRLPATKPAQTTTERPTGNNDAFQFWYLDGNKRVRKRVDAETTWEDSTQLLRMKIVYPLSQVNHPLAAELYGRERKGDTMVAQMREDAADPFPECPGFPEAPASKPFNPSNLSALLAEDRLLQRQRHSTTDPSRQLPAYLQKGTNAVASGSRSNDDNGNSDMRKAAAARSYSASLSQAGRAPSPPASQTPPSTAASSSSPVRPPPPRPLVRAATTAATSSLASALHRTASTPLPAHTRPRLSHAVPALPPIEHPSIYTPQTTFPDFQPRLFRAGEYTVYLILDKGENRAKDHEWIADKLRAHGVSVDRRQLSLGDVAWVAKHHNGEECMLDVVLERKRLDDLVGSIKDGRFHEQKFRLHRSGISRVLYLVEDYDTRRQKENYGPAISTAVSSTQVVDGFMVKETKNIDDTIAYLSGLTEELSRAHQTTDLHVIPTAHIRPHSYMDLQKYLRKKHPGKCFTTSFADYQKLNHKSVFTTVRDTWARMLLCVKGMSAEKVGAVVERWDTPRALWEAFRAAQIEEQFARAREAEEEAAAVAGPAKGKGKKKKKSTVPEARMMLQGVGGAEGGVRAIGPALSGKIYDLLMAVEYED